jgi:hypothetical protein
MNITRTEIFSGTQDSKTHRTKFFFGVFLVLYCVVLIARANFGVVDDHSFITTIFVGKWLDFFIIPGNGRFFPLDAQEYNLVSVMSNSAIAFYSFNALELVIVVFIFYKLFSLLTLSHKHWYLVFVVLGMLLLSPGFVTAWFRLFVPERNALFFFILFLFSYFNYQRKESVLTGLFGLLFANLALYYKEPGFLMLGTFVFCHLIFGWKVLKPNQKIFDFLLLGSSFIFILVYYFVVYRNIGKVLYGEIPYSQVLLFVKNIINYILIDPFLIFVLPLLIMYRIYLVCFKQSGKEPIYDSLLIASFVYVLVFLKLNMCAYHYLLPAYAFGITGMVYFLFKQEYLKHVFLKVTVSIGLIIFFSSLLPAGLHLISYYKNVPTNFQRTLDYLEAYIPTQNHRVNIYLDGVNRGSNTEVYHSFIAFLNFRGLDDKAFDFKSDLASDNKLLFSAGDPTSLYAVFQTNATTAPESGDLFILTPYSLKLFENRYLVEIGQHYELLYHAKSLIPIPNMSAKTLIKYILLGNVSNVSNEAMMNNNIFDTPLDFYVFIKR